MTDDEKLNDEGNFLLLLKDIRRAATMISASQLLANSHNSDFSLSYVGMGVLEVGVLIYGLSTTEDTSLYISTMIENSS